MTVAYIALGSNLQDPEKQLKTALAEIRALPQTALLQASSLYRTAPVGYDNQPDFINAVAQVETGLAPLPLLHALLEIEQKHGRERPFPNAPRILDLDLLMHGETRMSSQELTLPHPRMHERGFVMLPLAEIAAELEIPGVGRADSLAANCAGQGVERIPGSREKTNSTA